MIQKEFLSLIEESVSSCNQYFGKRMVAVYLHGSVSSGDAIPGISDLDCYIVVDEKLTNDDKKHINYLENILQQKYVIVDGVHLSVHSVDELKEDKFSRFILMHNSILYSGIDIARIIDANSEERYKADKQIAKQRIHFAKKCFQDALQGKQPESTGEIPQNTYYAARKFARYFVIIEGAYFLMSLNKFESFEKEKVLSQLRENINGYNEILDLTEKVIKYPIETGVKSNVFLEIVKPLVENMFKRIENS